MACAVFIEAGTTTIHDAIMTRRTYFTFVASESGARGKKCCHCKTWNSPTRNRCRYCLYVFRGAKPKPKPITDARKLANSQKQLKASIARVKRAATSITLWQRRVDYYSKKQAGLIKKYPKKTRPETRRTREIEL